MSTPLPEHSSPVARRHPAVSFVAVVAATLTVLGALVFPLPAEAESTATRTDAIASGTRLTAGQYRAAPGGSPRLVVQVDGNVVLLSGAKTLWSTRTWGNPGAELVLRTSGQLEVRTAAGVVLWSNGVRSTGARLVVKPDGRLYEISTTGASVWSTTAGSTTSPTLLRSTSPWATTSGTATTTGSATTAGSADSSGTGSVPLVAAPVIPSVLASAPQYVSPTSPAALAARRASAEGRLADAALLGKAAAQGSARWLTTSDTITTVEATVREVARLAQAAQQTPVFVTYAIPNRDCGSSSAGGFTEPDYVAWSAAIARGLVGTRSVVLVEPDSLLHVYRCGDPLQRFALLKQSSASYAAAGAEVYLDAGSSNSFGSGPVVKADMASRLTQAGVAQVAGFATNVANFQTTADERAYGNDLSALLGGARYVIDTSRNGNGGIRDANGAIWCNPPGRALGERPGATVDGPHVANLWVKTVGLSDGTCNGGPAAGVYWEPYLLGLAAGAHW